MNRIWMSIALVICFCCTACFEIVEEVSLNADGSGSVSFTLNASQSQTRLKSVMLMDSVNGRPVPKHTDIESELLKAKRILAGMSGISQVQVSHNHEDFIYVIKGEFRSVPQLNSAMNQLAIEMRKDRKNLKPIEFTPFDNYSYRNQTFERFQDPKDRSGDYHRAKEADRNVVENAQYTCLYRFERNVSSQSNPRGKVSKSGKAVMVKTRIKDIMLGRNGIRNTIKLQ